MPYTASLFVSSLVDGLQQQQQISVAGTNLKKVSESVAAAVAGSLTTRTDNDTGVVTAVDHGLTTSDVVGVFWRDAAGVLKYRIGMTATVSGNAVTVDGGDGVTGSSNLPAQGTSVTICKLATFTFDGDPAIANVKVLSLGSSTGLLDLVAQVHTGPDDDTAVNFLCNGQQINGQGGSNVNFGDVAALFETGLDTDTELAEVNVYNGSTSAGTFLATILT